MKDEFMSELNKIIPDLSQDVNYGDMYKKITDKLGIDLEQLEREMEQMSSEKVTLKYTSSTGKNLMYNYDSDSGFDLYSSDEYTIPAFGRMLIPTGISFQIPQDFEIQIRPKSGLALNHGLTVLNTPGTIDEGYNGEVKVIVFNTNPEPFTITRGMKIAQAVVARCVTGRWINLEKVEKLGNTERGNNGFGSTGT
jgi:dUTP pyrophosphatase